MATPASQADITLAIAFDAPSDATHARDLALNLGLPLLGLLADQQQPCPYQALLLVAGRQLAVQLTGKGAPGPLRVDFGSGAMRHRRKSGANELLGRAMGIGKKTQLRVLDGTAGLGRDAFVLADLGARVTLCERSAVVAHLLRSGIEAAVGSDDDWLSSVAQRMELRAGETCELSLLPGQFDVVYLDPMFPPRDKRAAVKKDMAVFQRLLGASASGAAAAELLGWALAQDVARVVVKRPVRAPALGERPVSHCIRGKTVRYDVYVLRSLTA